MYSVWSDYWFLRYFTRYFTSSTKSMKREHFSTCWCCYYIYPHSKVCTGLVVEFCRLLVDEMCWDCAVSVGMQWENGTVIWHLFQPHINFDVSLHTSFLETRIFCTSIFLALGSLCCPPTTCRQHHIKHSMPVLSLEMIPFTLEGRKINLYTCYNHTLVRTM